MVAALRLFRYVWAVPYTAVGLLLGGFTVLAGTLAVRLVSRALIFRSIGDREGLRLLGWLPLRDLAGIGSWFTALFKRSFVWRDLRFGLTRDGRIVPREP